MTLLCGAIWLFFISTKLPTLTWPESTVPGRSRENGPISQSSPAADAVRARSASARTVSAPSVQSREHGIRPDVHAVAEHDFAFEHDADVDEHVAADDDFAAHVDALGIGERHAARHERRRLAAAASARSAAASCARSLMPSTSVADSATMPSTFDSSANAIAMTSVR